MNIKNGGTYVNKLNGTKYTVYAIAKDIITGEKKVVLLSHESDMPCLLDVECFKVTFQEASPHRKDNL